MYYRHLIRLNLLLILIGAILFACGDVGSVGNNFELDVRDANSQPAQASEADILLQGEPRIVKDAEARFGYGFRFVRTNDELRWTLTSVEPGTYEVGVSARADIYKGAPELELSLNKSVKKTFPDSDYQKLSYGIFNVNEAQEVSLRFTNDLWGGADDKDRNITVDYLSFERVEAPMPEPEDPADPEPEDPEPEDPEPEDPAEPESVTVTYRADTSDFPNPERGFHGNIDLLGGADFGYIKTQGYTLARAYILLDDYLDKPLDDDFLSALRRGLSAARTAGIKVIPRFSYNFPQGDYQDAAEAPIDLALEHIAQLEPLYETYSDIIAVHPAGFVGAWGEWHSSGPNNLDSPENKRKILNALLAAMPADLMVQLRYPGDLLDIYPQVLGSNQAFLDTYQARVGHHNDCFLANDTDAGTYSPEARGAAFKDYLEELTRFSAMGGETCQATPALQRSDCETTLAELARFRWDYLNIDFWDGAINRWKSEGCFEEISKRLGYRYTLTQSELSASEAEAGESVKLTLSMKNSGFGKLYKPRPTQIVLRARDGDAQHTVTLDEDSRKLLPAAGETATIPAEIDLPEDLAAGIYDLYLALPDNDEALRERSEYSIRLANAGVWDAQSGMNALNVSVEVK